MANTIPQIETTSRKELGSLSMQELRDEGKLPAVLYGHKKDNVNLTLDAHSFQTALRERPILVTLKVDGKDEHAIIKDLQYFHVGPQLLHVDFQRVALDERVTVTTELEFFGTPKGADRGGRLEVVRNNVVITTRADNIPKSIEVNVAPLELDESIRASDLNLPEGAELTGPSSSFIARCNLPRRAKSPKNAAAAATAEGAEGEAAEAKAGA